MNVCIIIPAHNEEKRIATTLDRYGSFFEKVSKQTSLRVNMLVVVNNSSDKTLDIASLYSNKYDSIRFIDLKRGGKGYAVVEGFKKAIAEKYDLIGFVDADMATSPEDYYALIEEAVHYDGAIADRTHPNSRVYPPATFRRIIVSRIFNFCVRVLFGLPYRDTQCGAKIFHLSALSNVIHRMGMTKWAFDVELLYLLKKEGYTIEAVPTVWVDKEYSKINFMRSGPWMFLGIVRLRMFHSPLRAFIKIYDFVLERLK